MKLLVWLLIRLTPIYWAGVIYTLARHVWQYHRPSMPSAQSPVSWESARYWIIVGVCGFVLAFIGQRVMSSLIGDVPSQQDYLVGIESDRVEKPLIEMKPGEHGYILSWGYDEDTASLEVGYTFTAVPHGTFAVKVTRTSCSFIVDAETYNDYEKRHGHVTYIMPHDIEIKSMTVSGVEKELCEPPRAAMPFEKGLLLEPTPRTLNGETERLLNGNPTEWHENYVIENFNRN